MFRLPPFTKALIIANAVAFLLQMLAGNAMLIWFALWPGEGGGIGSLPLLAPWTLVTYSFLHDTHNFMHIAFNMLAVWMFGAEIERVWGAQRTAAAYFASVVTGALAQILIGAMFGEGGGPVVGASAGVFGLLLAYALLFPNRRIMPLFPPIPMPARVFVLLYAVLELVFGVTGMVSGVAHFAHLGGLVGGWLVYKYWRVRPRNWGR